jgi:hypothetical protein
MFVPHAGICSDDDTQCPTCNEARADALVGGYLGCECSGWCRADPQPITDRHHKNCNHYNDSIRVVKITLEGHGSYCDADIPGALVGLADGDDYTYQVEIMQMLVRDYEALPEHTGF